MRLLYIFALTLLTTTCQQSKNRVDIFNANEFVLVDTNLNGNKLLTLGESYSNYPIYFIGSKADTIKIGKRYEVGQIDYDRANDFFACRKYTNSNLKLFVDTSVKTTISVDYFSKDYRSLDSTRSFKSYILTLENISDSSIYLGRTFEVYFLIRQVLNKNGQWINLDRSLSETISCLSGQPTIILYPNEIIISKFKRYNGTFLTSFRFAFGTQKNVVYSNDFTDYIDEGIIQNKKDKLREE